MLTRDYKVPDRLAYSRRLHSQGSDPSPCRMTAGLAANPANSSNGAANDGVVDVSSLLTMLVEGLPKGLIVLSADAAIVYWNQNAKRLCQKLSGAQRYWTLLPAVVVDLCEQIVEARSADEPVLLEYQTPEHCSLRLTAAWLARGTNDDLSPILDHHSYILVTIEDRDEVLQQDIQVEQKKFQLTNREAEVWLLLRQEYSYQAIAKTLHISLNTVKTHIRNIHAKRHPYQALPA